MDLVIHHNDPDGWLSAAIIVETHADRSMLCFEASNTDYGDQSRLREYLLSREWEIIYMVDFSVPAATFDGVTRKRMAWFDHHIRAKEYLPDYAKIFDEIHFDDKCSACMLVSKAYLAQHNLAVMVSVYDSWQKECPFFQRALLIHTALATVAQINPMNGCRDIPDLDRLEELGRIVVKARESYDAQTRAETATELTTASGKRCLCFNTALRGSQMFGHGFKNYDYCIAWYRRPDGMYGYSVYTHEENASEFCQKYLNGGGHKGAAGGFHALAPQELLCSVN